MNHRPSLDHCDAVIFDLDGVITDTAALHFDAWKEVFDECLRRRDPQLRPFTEEDYRQYVDGKPRFEGIRSFLASRDIDLPYDEEGQEGEEGKGAEDAREDDDLETVLGIGAAKNARYRRRLDDGEIPVYAEAVALVEKLRQREIATGVVSSSKNCKFVLREAGLADLFEVRVDGLDLVERDDLAGKPAPDMFLEAARQLGVAPERAAVFEDAESGVEAGRAGGFGLVVGVARTDDAEDIRKSLLEHGADVVVTSLAELEVASRGSDSG